MTVNDYHCTLLYYYPSPILLCYTVYLYRKVNKRRCHIWNHATLMSNFQSISTFLDSTVSSVARTASSFTHTTNSWLPVCHISDRIQKNLTIILMSVSSLHHNQNKLLRSTCASRPRQFGGTVNGNLSIQNKWLGRMYTSLWAVHTCTLYNSTLVDYCDACLIIYLYSSTVAMVQH